LSKGNRERSRRNGTERQWKFSTIEISCSNFDKTERKATRQQLRHTRPIGLVLQPTILYI